MGILSTVCITRTRAIEELKKALERKNIEDIFLVKAMDELIRDNLKNCTIVPDNEENDDDELDWILAE